MCFSDVDECDLNIAQCHPNQDCVNNVGSFKCVARCDFGFRRAPGGIDCQGWSHCLMIYYIIYARNLNVISLINPNVEQSGGNTVDCSIPYLRNG